MILLQFELVTFRFAYMRSLKPFISMISGLLDVSLSPKTIYCFLWRYQNPHNTSRKFKLIPKSYFYKSEHVGHRTVWKLWKRQAPKNGEDPFNKILKILEMGPISS